MAIFHCYVSSPEGITLVEPSMMGPFPYFSRAISETPIVWEDFMGMKVPSARVSQGIPINSMNLSCTWRSLWVAVATQSAQLQGIQRWESCHSDPIIPRPWASSKFLIRSLVSASCHSKSPSFVVVWGRSSWTTPSFCFQGVWSIYEHIGVGL